MCLSSGLERFLRTDQLILCLGSTILTLYRKCLIVFMKLMDLLKRLLSQQQITTLDSSVTEDTQLETRHFLVRSFKTEPPEPTIGSDLTPEKNSQDWLIHQKVKKELSAFKLSLKN